MTREEEIRNQAEAWFDLPQSQAIFMKAAEWADQHPKKGLWDNNEVIKFIKENVREYHKSGVFHLDDFINDLRKTMEE